MAELCFKMEVVEKLLLEAGFSDIESTPFVSFEEPQILFEQKLFYIKTLHEKSIF